MCLALGLAVGLREVSFASKCQLVGCEQCAQSMRI